MDKDLRELLDFVEGKTLPHLGDGITTYTGRDENQIKLHTALFEL